jgi:hypothetical protein
VSLGLSQPTDGAPGATVNAEANMIAALVADAADEAVAADAGVGGRAGADAIARARARGWQPESE